MTLRNLGAVGLLLGLAACASSPSYRERQDAELGLFERHAGEPIERVRAFSGVDRWQALSPVKLVIWIGASRAYLLTMRAPCAGLEYQSAIAITSSNNIIDLRFDKLRFEQQVCYFSEIRPVDYKAVRQERRESRPDA